MSDLQVENEQLKNQLAQNSVGVQNLSAQLEAHKQSLSESINVGLNLRTNCVLLQKHIESLNVQCDEGRKLVDKLNARIAELEAEKASSQCASEPAQQAA